VFVDLLFVYFFRIQSFYACIPVGLPKKSLQEKNEGIRNKAIHKEMKKLMKKEMKNFELNAYIEVNGCRKKETNKRINK